MVDSDVPPNPGRRSFLKRVGVAGGGLAAHGPGVASPRQILTNAHILLGNLFGDYVHGQLIGLISFATAFEELEGKDIAGLKALCNQAPGSDQKPDWAAVEQLQNFYLQFRYDDGVSRNFKFSHLQDAEKIRQVLEAKGVDAASIPAMVERCTHLARIADAVFPGDLSMEDLTASVENRLGDILRQLIRRPDDLLADSALSTEAKQTILMNFISATNGKNIDLQEPLSELGARLHETDPIMERHRRDRAAMVNPARQAIECTVDELDPKGQTNVYSIRPVDRGERLTTMHLRKFCDAARYGGKRNMADSGKREETRIVIEGSGQTFGKDDFEPSQAQARIETNDPAVIKALGRAAEAGLPVYIPALSAGVVKHPKHTERLAHKAAPPAIPVQR